MHSASACSLHPTLVTLMVSSAVISLRGSLSKQKCYVSLLDNFIACDEVHVSWVMFVGNVFCTVLQAFTSIVFTLCNFVSSQQVSLCILTLTYLGSL